MRKRRDKDGSVSATTSVLDYVHLSAAVLQRARQGVPLAQIGRAVDETLQGNVPNHSGQNPKAVASPLLNAGGSVTVVRAFSKQSAAFSASTPSREGRPDASAAAALPRAGSSTPFGSSVSFAGGSKLGSTDGEEWMSDLQNALSSRVSSSTYRPRATETGAGASIVPLSPMRPPAASYGAPGMGSFGSGTTPLYSVSKASSSLGGNGGLNASSNSLLEAHTGIAFQSPAPKLRWNPKNAGAGLGAASGGISALVTGAASSSSPYVGGMSGSGAMMAFNSLELLPPGADGSIPMLSASTASVGSYGQQYYQHQQSQHQHSLPPFPTGSISRLGEPSTATTRSARGQGGNASSADASLSQRGSSTGRSRSPEGPASSRKEGSQSRGKGSPRPQGRSKGGDADADTEGGADPTASKSLSQPSRMGKHFDLAASAVSKYSTTVIQLASALPAVLANSMQQTASVVTVPSVPDVFSSILGDSVEAAYGFDSNDNGGGSPGRPGSPGGSRKALAALAAAGMLPGQNQQQQQGQGQGGQQPLIGADSVFGESVDSLVQTAANAAAGGKRGLAVGFSEGTVGGLSSGSPSPVKYGGEMGGRFPAKNPGLGDLPEALKSSLRLFAPPQSRTESWLSRGKNKVDHLRLMLKSASASANPGGLPAGGDGNAGEPITTSPVAGGPGDGRNHPSPSQQGPGHVDPDNIPTDRLPTVNQLLAEAPTGSARNRVLREINEDERTINNQQSNVSKTVKGVGHANMTLNLQTNPLAAMGFGISSGEEARKRLAEKRAKAELEEQLRRQRRAKRRRARQAARDLAGVKGRRSDDEADDGADMDTSDEEDRKRAGLENKERMRTIEKLRTDLARLAQRAKFMNLRGAGAPIDAALDELEEGGAGALESKKGEKVRLRLTLPADPTPALRASNELEQTSTLRVAIERAKLSAPSPWAAREAVVEVLETARSGGMSTSAIHAALTKKQTGGPSSPRRQREAEREEEKQLMEQLDKMKKQQAQAAEAAKKKKRKQRRRGSDATLSSDEGKSSDDEEAANADSKQKDAADDAGGEENKEEDAALYTAKVYGPQFNSSPEAQIYYGSTIALETVDGWFLTVHPRTGVVSVREPEPFWYEKGTMPFRKSRTIGGAFKEMPHYLFKVINLKNPMENGPVRFGDPIYLQVCSGRGENGWKTGSIMAPYLHHAISIDTAGVDLFGRPADFHMAGKAGDNDPLLKTALMAASAENLLFGMPATAAALSVQQRKSKLSTVGLGHILGPHDDDNNPNSRMSSRAATTAGGSSRQHTGRRSGSPSPPPRPDSTLALINAAAAGRHSSRNGLGTPSSTALGHLGGHGSNSSRPGTGNFASAMGAVSGLGSDGLGVEGAVVPLPMSSEEGMGGMGGAMTTGGDLSSSQQLGGGSVFAQFANNQSGLLGVNASSVLGGLPPEAVAELLDLLSHLPPSAAAAILESRTDAAGGVGSGVYNALSALASGVLDEEALNRLFPNGVPATRLPFDSKLKSVSYGRNTRVVAFQRRSAQFIPSMGASTYSINAPPQLTPTFSNLAGSVPVNPRLAQLSMANNASASTLGGPASSSAALAGPPQLQDGSVEGVTSPTGAGSPRLGSPSGGNGVESDGEGDGGGTFLTALALTSGNDAKPSSSRQNQEGAVVPHDAGAITAASSVAFGGSVIIGDGDLSAENSMVAGNAGAGEQGGSGVVKKDGPTLQELVSALMHQFWYSRELPKAKTMDQISIVRELQKDVAGNARPNPLDRVGKHLGIPRPIVAHVPTPFAANDFLYGPATASNRQGVYRRNDPGFSILYEMANARPIMAGKWRFQVALKEVTEGGYVIGALGFEGHIEDEQYISATNIKRLLQKAKKSIVKTVTKQEDPLHGAATVLALKRSAKGPNGSHNQKKDPFASSAKVGSLEGADTMDTAAQVAGIAGDDDEGPGNSAVAKAKNANASAAMAAAMSPSESDLINGYIMNLTEIYLEQEWYYIAYSPAQPGDPDAVPSAPGLSGVPELQNEDDRHDEGGSDNKAGENGDQQGNGAGEGEFLDDEDDGPVGAPQLNLLGDVSKGPAGSVQASSFVGADGVTVKVASSARDSSTHFKQKYDGISGGNKRPTHLQGTATTVMGQYKIDKRGVFRIRLLQSGDKSEGAQMSRDDSIALRARSQLRNSERLRVGVITEEEAAAQAAAKEAEGDPLKRVDPAIPINETTITNPEILKRLREGNLSLKGPGVTPAEKLPKALRLARARALIEAGSRYLSHEALKFGVPEKYYESRLDGVMSSIEKESHQIAELASIAESNELNRIQRKTPFLKRAKNAVPYREQLARVEMKMEAERTARLYNSSRSVRGSAGGGGMNSPPHTPITPAAIQEINSGSIGNNNNASAQKPYVFVGPQLGVGLGGPSARELDKMAAKNKKKGGAGATGSQQQQPSSAPSTASLQSAGGSYDSRAHTHAHGPGETCRLCSSSSGAPIFVVDLCSVGTQAKSDLKVELAAEAEEERIRRLQKAINEGVIIDEDDPRAAAVMEGKDPDAEQEEDPLAASNVVIFKRPASIAATEAEKQKKERQKRRKEEQSTSGTGKPRTRGRSGISGRRRGDDGGSITGGGSSVSPSPSRVSLSRPGSTSRSMPLSRLGTGAAHTGRSSGFSPSPSPSRASPVPRNRSVSLNSSSRGSPSPHSHGRVSRGASSSPIAGMTTSRSATGYVSGETNNTLLVRASGVVSPYAGIIAASQAQSRMQTAIVPSRSSPSPSPSPPPPSTGGSFITAIDPSGLSAPGTAHSGGSVVAGGAVPNKRKNSVRRLTIGLTEAFKQRKAEVDYDAPMADKIEAREVALGSTVEMMNKHKAKMKALQERRQKEAEEEVQARMAAAATASAASGYMARRRASVSAPPIEVMMVMPPSNADDAAFGLSSSSLSIGGSMSESQMVAGESVLVEDEATGALIEVPGATVVVTGRTSSSSDSSATETDSSTARGQSDRPQSAADPPAPPPQMLRRRNSIIVDVTSLGPAGAASSSSSAAAGFSSATAGPPPSNLVGVSTLHRRLSFSGGAGMIVSSVTGYGEPNERESSRPDTMASGTSRGTGTDSVPPTAGGGIGGRRASISGKAFRAPPDPYANLDALLQLSSDSVAGAETRFLSTLSKQDTDMMDVIAYQIPGLNRSGGLLSSIEARFAAARRAAAAAANGDDEDSSGLAKLGLSQAQNEEEVQRENLFKLASRGGNKPGTGGLIPGSRGGSRVDSAVGGDLLSLQQPVSRTIGVGTPTHGRRAGVSTPSGGMGSGNAGFGPMPSVLGASGSLVATPSRQWPPVGPLGAIEGFGPSGSAPNSRGNSRSPSRGGPGGGRPGSSHGLAPQQLQHGSQQGSRAGSAGGAAMGLRSSGGSVFLFSQSVAEGGGSMLGGGTGSTTNSHPGSRVGTGHGPRH